MAWPRLYSAVAVCFQRIATPKLGQLTNRMTLTNEAPPWTFGISHLYRNLAARGLFKG